MKCLPHVIAFHVKSVTITHRNPLFHSLDNVLLSSHIGSASQETRDGMADLVIANIEAVFNGKQPLTPVL